MQVYCIPRLVVFSMIRKGDYNALLITTMRVMKVHVLGKTVVDKRQRHQIISAE